MSKSKPQGTSPVRRFLSIVGIVLCAVFAFLLACNLTIIIKGALYPDRPPSVLGFTPMVTLSGSMSGEQEGHIEVGDLIFVGKAEPEALKAGDVIAFMQGETIITHRIQEVVTAEDGSLQFITRGDANNAADAKPVAQDELVGIYRARIPKLGDLALFMQKPIGMLLFIGIPIALFIIYDILRRQVYARKQKSQESAMREELERLRKLAGEDQAP